MIKLICEYAKKLGLPNFSSHQFSIRLETEITDLSQVQAESSRLYKLLQQGVDNSIQATGFLPTETKANGNGHANGYTNGNGHHRSIKPAEEPWKCSPKQKELILKITDENHLDKNQVEQLAQERFGKGVKGLNKLEASGLIEELIEKYPSKQGRGK